MADKPVLRFRPDGHFRVLMMSDFHGKPDFFEGGDRYYIRDRNQNTI